MVNEKHLPLHIKKVLYIIYTTMIINVIVAMDERRGIGKNNLLPWNIPSDLKYFSKLTKGSGNNAIIMGRKTHQSI